jgi:hypothetical protein
VCNRITPMQFALIKFAREARQSHRQGNEFQNKFQIKNNEKCNEYCEKRISETHLRDGLNLISQ